MFVAGIAVVGTPVIASVDVERSALMTTLDRQQIGRFRIAQIFFDGSTGRVDSHFIKQNYGTRRSKVQIVHVGIIVCYLHGCLDDPLFHVGERAGSTCL
jgi:hypothetical protein